MRNLVVHGNIHDPSADNYQKGHSHGMKLGSVASRHVTCDGQAILTTVLILRNQRVQESNQWSCVTQAVRGVSRPTTQKDEQPQIEWSSSPLTLVSIQVELAQRLMWSHHP